MKPIFVIDDFSQGISYDETENTVEGFNDLVSIDLKNINGVAMLANDYHNVFSTSNFTNTNHLVEYKLIPDIGSTGESQMLGIKRGASATIYMGNSVAKTFSVLQSDSGGEGCPMYAESVIFKNRLFYPTDKKQLNTLSFWSTGNVTGITANASTTLTITSVGGAKIQTADQSLVGGTIYLSLGSTWFTRTISSYAAGAFVVNSAVATGSYYAYIVTPSANVTKSDGTTTSLPTANYSTLYRPMISHDSKLYVGDGDMIYSLDDTLTNWKTTNGQLAISVGTDYTVKQIKQLGGYLYILADEVDKNFANTFTAPTNYTPSKLYIWDGTSVGFSSIIEIGAHCFNIEARENRIYANIQSNKDDGILFTYFNGSDFPTIAKFQVPNATMPVAGMTYDRGRFYCAVNNVSGIVYNAYIFSYSSYAIETPCVSKVYFRNDSSAFQINTVDMIQLGASPIFVLNDGGSSSGNAMFYRNNSAYCTFGHIITQKYEITPNQFGQLIRGVQLNFKETMTSDSSVAVYYKADEDSSFTLIGTLTSANQNMVLYGIMKRMKKIQLDLVPTSNTGLNTPKIVKISLF